MDTKAIGAAGHAPLADIASILKSLMHETSGIADALVALAHIGVSPLISMDTGPDERNPDAVVIKLSPPTSLGLPSKESYDNATLLDEYRNIAVDAISAIDPSGTRDVFAKAINLEIELAGINPDQGNRDDITARSPTHSIDRRWTT